MNIHPLYKKCYAPYTEWKFLEEYFMRLPEKYSFDLEEMRKYVNSVVSEVGLNKLSLKDKVGIYSEGYTGFGFTHRKDASDPHHDAFKIFNDKGEFEGSANSRRPMQSTLKASNVHRFEKNFTEKTEFYDGPIKKVLENFASPITKVRVMELAPGSNVHNHFDYPYYENVRLHAVLETNEDVEWWVEDNCFKIPSDGNFYWFDTGRFHQIINKGKTPRRVLSVHLSVFKDLEDKLRFDPNHSLIDIIKSGLI